MLYLWFKRWITRSYPGLALLSNQTVFPPLGISSSCLVKKKHLLCVIKRKKSYQESSRLAVLNAALWFSWMTNTQSRNYPGSDPQMRSLSVKLTPLDSTRWGPFLRRRPEGIWISSVPLELPASLLRGAKSIRKQTNLVSWTLYQGGLWFPSPSSSGNLLYVKCQPAEETVTVLFLYL